MRTTTDGGTVQTAAAEVMTDPECPAEIAERLLWTSTYHVLRQVQCSFDNGVLTMDGCLSSFYLKQIAQTVVQDIDGVARIENRIEVQS